MPMEMEGKDNGNGGDETPNRNQQRDSKVKSCKGYLYYNSTLKSNSLNPRCFGISRTLNQVPDYILRQQPDVEASKEGQSPKDFNYSCVGYSVYLDRSDHSNDEQGTNIELPACAGLEVLAERRVSTSDPLSSPFRVHNRKDEKEIPHPQAQKPAYSMGDEFLSRFTRNASLVAAGVTRNIQRVGNRIKERLDDILYPYRRRPK